MNSNNTNKYLRWLKKHKLIKVKSILENKFFVAQLFLSMIIFTGMKPETEKTGFFIFSFLLCLFLLINALKTVNPFESKSTNYIFTIIFGGLLLDYTLTKFTWEFLTKIGTTTPLNQQIINETFQKFPEKAVELNLTQIVLAPIIEETCFRLFFFGAIVSLCKSFNFSNKVSYSCFILFSSLLFGFAHSFDNPLTSIMYLIPGLIFSISYVLSKSIYVPISIHIINNAIASIHSDTDVNLPLIMLILTLAFWLIEYLQKNKFPSKL